MNKILTSRTNYDLYIQYGFKPEQLHIVEDMPRSENKKIDTKHYMKFQKAKR